MPESVSNQLLAAIQSLFHFLEETRRALAGYCDFDVSLVRALSAELRTELDNIQIMLEWRGERAVRCAVKSLRSGEMSGKRQSRPESVATTKYSGG